MPNHTLKVALITDAFPDESHWPRLLDLLREAKAGGGELAVLPEIPLNPWSPVSKIPRPEDAEEVEGPRQRFQAQVAKKEYPGYLKSFPELYAEGWKRVGDR